jgi:hypothetical protein
MFAGVEGIRGVKYARKTRAGAETAAEQKKPKEFQREIGRINNAHRSVLFHCLLKLASLMKAFLRVSEFT